MRPSLPLRLVLLAGLLVALGLPAAGSPPEDPGAHRRSRGAHGRILETVDAVKRQLERRLHGDRLADAEPGAEPEPAPSPDAEPPEPTAPPPGS